MGESETNNPPPPAPVFFPRDGVVKRADRRCVTAAMPAPAGAHRSWGFNLTSETKFRKKPSCRFCLTMSSFDWAAAERMPWQKKRGLLQFSQRNMAVGQNQWYHFKVGAPLVLVGDWDVQFSREAYCKQLLIRSVWSQTKSKSEFYLPCWADWIQIMSTS